MRENTARPLTTLTGIVCLVIAGWLAIHQFNQDEGETISKSKIRIGNTKATENHLTKRPSQSRSLEELNGVLAEAKEEWESLKDTRFFFEDYADEVVTDFSLEEIELLGIERMGHDFRNVVGFQYAIMRRWGALDMQGATAHFIERYRYYQLASEKAFYLRRQSESKKDCELLGEPTLSGEAKDIEPLVYTKEQLAALESLQMRENGLGSTTDYLGTFHRMLYKEMKIGSARENPDEKISLTSEWIRNLREKGALDRGALNLLSFRELEVTLKSFTENDHRQATALLNNKEQLKNLSPSLDDADETIVKINAAPLMSGYFKGLPKNSDWPVIYHSLDPEFQEDSLLPMVARWMEEDANTATDWVRGQLAPAGYCQAYSEYGERDPFATDDLEPLSFKPQPRNGHASIIGLAAGQWFRSDPHEASEWISKNLQNLSPEFFERSFYQMVSHNSPTGFLKLFSKVREIEDIQKRGEVILTFEMGWGHDFFTRQYSYRYQWRKEERILEVLKGIEVAANHQDDVKMLIKRAEESIRERNNREEN